LCVDKEHCQIEETVKEAEEEHPQTIDSEKNPLDVEQ
jgi:hypothetical protein